MLERRGSRNQHTVQRAEETHANLFTNHKYEKILALIFLCTLPLVNPWVRGDGVGYYAYARALLIEHHLDFRQDWLHANSSFRMGRVDDQDRILPAEFTSTGHVDNHFSIGPAILWSPFLLAAHAAVKINHLFGGHIPADGFSFPYIFAMALATALYGFLGIFLSFEIARKYFPARWAFLGSWAFGLRVPCRSICTSILRGLTRIPHSRWRCSSGIGTHPRGSHLDAMAGPRLDLRPDDGRLLHLRGSAGGAFARISRWLLARNPVPANAAGGTPVLAECSLCVDHIFGVPAHPDREKNHLWRLLEFGYARALEASLHPRF